MNLNKSGVLALATLMPFSMLHAAWVVQPSIETRAAYDDNAQLRLDENKDGGVVSRATVRARLANITETSQASGIVGISYTSNAGIEEIDDQDSQFAQFVFSKSYQLGSLGGAVSVNRDSVMRWSRVLTDPFGAQDETEIDLELIDLANNIDDLDRTVVREQLDRTRVHLSPRASYTINERTRAVLRYNYYQSTFDDESLAEQLGAQDTRSQSIEVGLRRNVNERTQLGFELRGADNDPDRANGSKSFKVEATLRRNLTERTDLDVGLGATRIDPDGAGQVDDGFAGSIQLNHKTSGGSLRVAFRRDVYPSAFGSMLESDTFLLNYRHAYSSRTALSITARGISSESSSETSRQNRDYVQITPEIFWALSETWRLSGGYRFTWNERDSERDAASSNSVFLTLAYQPRTDVR